MADLKPCPNPKCEVCKRSFTDGITLIRQNEKGVPGIWRCKEHNSKRDPVLDRAIFDVQAEQSLEVVAWNLECQTLGGDTGWILSWSRSGVGLCNRLSGVEHEVALTDHAKATAALAQKDAEIAELKHQLELSNGNSKLSSTR